MKSRIGCRMVRKGCRMSRMGCRMSRIGCWPPEEMIY